MLAIAFDISYRPGKENLPADAFSRAYCASVTTSSLVELHNSLCHPGVTRMVHFVRSKNLPFSVDDVKRVTSACSVCAKCKPRFHRPPQAQLVKAVQPFDRISIDFKGPLPSSTRNRYLLTVVDEFSRFPFAFACSDVTSRTVINCLTQLFAIFGMPAYVHSDRGAAFMSSELRQFLTNHGVATSRTTPYNPQGNGQCERYNGIIWRSVTMALHSRNLPVTQWEVVLHDALHSIRSLLCTASNSTPHERLFSFQRRSSVGCSIPSWLTTPGPVLLKRHVRQSKYEPLVEEVSLLDANPQFAHVRFADGKETSVSLHDLAPSGSMPVTHTELSSTNDNVAEPVQTVQADPLREPDIVCEPVNDCSDATDNDKSAHQGETLPRRSTRSRRSPRRYSP